MSAPSWLTRLPRPALMAIGDSLLNGMRSYSIDEHLAALSIPAQLGTALRTTSGFEPFSPTTYPAPVLGNAEEILRETLDNRYFWETPISAILRQSPLIMQDVAANARLWLSRFNGPADMQARPAFHNLALAGAAVEDMFEVTLREIDARLATMSPKIQREGNPLSWTGPWPSGDRNAGFDKNNCPKTWGVFDVHMAINARHLRNPANRDGLQGMTAVDIVAARRPRVLLVNLGPNHGMIDIVMRYEGQEGLKGLQAFAQDWPARARLLAGLPGVEVVVVQLMPLPTQIPCMSPFFDSRQPEPAPPGGNRYFPTYVSAFDPPPQGSGSSYNSSDARKLDEGVQAVNAEVRAATEAAFRGSGKHLRIVSLAEILAPYDYKHRRGQPLRVAGTGRLYDNYPISGYAAGRRPLKGGLCGLDHIHPTGLGYRFIAEEIRKQLPASIASEPIAVHDSDDEFLIRPHRPTLELLNYLLPSQPSSFGGIMDSLRPPTTTTPPASGLLRLLFDDEQRRCG